MDDQDQMRKIIKTSREELDSIVTEIRETIRRNKKANIDVSCLHNPVRKATTVIQELQKIEIERNLQIRNFHRKLEITLNRFYSLERSIIEIETKKLRHSQY